ncbi:MAG: alpha-hydroxy-acid oxidizing protein [Lachnospiraceae bacterium]|jgi:isopentenyl diphosphate isomerase/L-lactate dehydrogenase-like FMN-dependent dehydrogenase|nr:alpha-hydroxy-acid oxidizing protein [Lachnospiraceae bacterium]
MTYDELIASASGTMGTLCKPCKICNGKVCAGNVPGPGAKGSGTVAIRNFEKWNDIRLQMDTICENKPVDTKFSVFGKTFKYPIFAAPVGALKLHYGDKYDDLQYNDILVSACADAGIAAFTGDGTNPDVMLSALKAISQALGLGVPTIKPWDANTLKSKIEAVKAASPFAVAMDIDAAGLPFLKNLTPPAGSISVSGLSEIAKALGVPFILKGIMTVKGALKAKEAGVAGIVVSNHGGRVLDSCPATAEVLGEIKDAVGDSLKVFVDGGIRDGITIFKALALGADAVLIGRPFVTAVYGGGNEGVRVYTEKLASELIDTMAMCGAHSLDEITRDMIRV